MQDFFFLGGGGGGGQAGGWRLKGYKPINTRAFRVVVTTVKYYDNIPKGIQVMELT